MYLQVIPIQSKEASLSLSDDLVLLNWDSPVSGIWSSPFCCTPFYNPSLSIILTRMSLGIDGDPSVSKSNQFTCGHGSVFLPLLIEGRYILKTPPKMISDCPKPGTSPGYLSNSTGSSLTSWPVTPVQCILVSGQSKTASENWCLDGDLIPQNHSMKVCHLDSNNIDCRSCLITVYVVAASLRFFTFVQVFIYWILASICTVGCFYLGGQLSLWRTGGVFIWDI